MMKKGSPKQNNLASKSAMLLSKQKIAFLSCLFISSLIIRKFIIMPFMLRPYLREMSAPLLLHELPSIARHEPMIYASSNCSKEDDFLRYLTRRHNQWGIKEQDKLGYYKPTKYLQKHKIWQYLLDDKMASYILAKTQSVRVPQILACGDNASQTLEGFAQGDMDNENGHEYQDRGFVVKNSSSFDSKGVWVYEHGFRGIESVRGHPVSKEELANQLQGSSIFVEEYIRPHIPGERILDFKVFAFNGIIAAIGIIRRFASADSTSSNCHVYVDEYFQFMDTVCVKPQRKKCTRKTNLLCSFCGEFQQPTQWNKMMYWAKKLSMRIGVAMRIDFYIDGMDGEPILGEITPASSAGHFHCMAKIDRRTGEVDSCWIGRLWKESSVGGNNTKLGEGGPITPIPDLLQGWENMSYKEKCQEIMNIDQTISYIVG